MVDTFSHVPKSFLSRIIHMQKMAEMLYVACRDVARNVSTYPIINIFPLKCPKRHIPD